VPTVTSYLDDLGAFAPADQPTVITNIDKYAGFIIGVGSQQVAITSTAASTTTGDRP
jgi:hypothetical protein